MTCGPNTEAKARVRVRPRDKDVEVAASRAALERKTRSEQGVLCFLEFDTPRKKYRDCNLKGLGGDHHERNVGRREAGGAEARSL